MTESDQGLTEAVSVEADHLDEEGATDREESTPGEQSELDLGVVATGHAGVDAALTSLDGLGERPVADHPAVFEQVHRALDEAMTSLEDDGDSASHTADRSTER